MIQINPKVETLTKHVMTIGYGETITHQEISQLLEESYGTARYRALIARANKELIKLGKALVSVQKVGYRVLEPDEYASTAVQSYAKGFTCFKKGTSYLESAPTAHMSKEGLTAHREVSDRARSLFASMAGGTVELKLLARKPCALSVENVGRT